MEVEYTGPEPEPEIVTQQYAVRAVVDTLQKKVCNATFTHSFTRTYKYTRIYTLHSYMSKNVHEILISGCYV